ncbi:homeobox domain protein [Ceratobasidium sp. AG-Ba]|nr:homeobox domain protein [Ceratobasidium sp. AG-Ba]
MTDLRLVRAIGSVRSKLEPFVAYGHDNHPASRPPPSFNAHVLYSPLKTPLPEFSAEVELLGLSEESTQAIVSVLTTETLNYRNFLESSRRRLLEDLSTVPLSSNPSELAGLLETACETFLGNLTTSGIEAVRKHFASVDLQQQSGTEAEGSIDSAEESESEADDDCDQSMEIDRDIEEDDNMPIKPGEEVPPLDTKFLPIFEALHERGKVLTKPEKTYLVNMTGMTYRQITIWFQNRRRGELKEDANMHASSVREGSVHSLDSSDASEGETELEKHLNSATDTTFDIRSWRLTSALATKDGHGASLPPSPTKFTFGAQAAASGYESDDTELSDSDDEVDAPPGLRVPSLTGSVATLDSATIRSANSSQVLGLVEPVIVSETSPGAGVAPLPRPVKSLPLSRRSSLPVVSQPTQPQAAAFNFNFTGAALMPTQQQVSNPPASVPVPPSQLVTSNERGLSVEMNGAPPLSASTLRSPSPTAPPVPRFTTPPAPVTASSPSNSGSRQNSSSPSPQTSSPRPAVKPLPRRTGCAPRPRPPPRMTPASTSAQASSARASVVLPPASNPSLAATTLGALLRPSAAPPAIPSEMQERLSAMAGRMGVSASSTARNGSVSALQFSGAVPTASGQRSFSFGPTSLPLVGSTGLVPVSEQRTSTTDGGSPMPS